MPIYVSLLRGINVGGNKKIKMADLRALYGELGFKGTKTILQSGNVVFETDLTDSAQIAQQIEAAIEAQYGFHSKIIMRSAVEFQAVANKNPYADNSDFDPAKMLVMFLSDVPTTDALQNLKEAHTGPETIEHGGRELYLYYPEGIARSKLDNNFIDKRLKQIGTGRNWKTVNRILKLIAEFETSN